ncbi:MAG: hypothetical protein JWO37_848 [Acidimicrobiales bacterium]|nr:hypothetical protein [Acidimicrobiales bacterium]
MRARHRAVVLVGAALFGVLGAACTNDNGGAMQPGAATTTAPATTAPATTAP